MLRTGVVVDPRYLDHGTGAGHPERPERVEVLLELLDAAVRPGMVRVEPRPATRGELQQVHAPGYVEQVAATAGTAFFAFDADTPVSARSHETALLAAGGLLAVLDGIMAGELDNGFALVRPPGHHAEADRAMGFCLFNNVAVGAEYLRRQHGLERVLVMDWDVHHGNGTQHSFANDPGVLYVSTHQYPFYPGTGAPEEIGRGDGEGFTVNLPLPAGCGDAEYSYLFEQIVDPICRQYRPELVLVSAGFDAHVRDPLGGMRVTTEGFGQMARVLLKVARDCSAGRLAAVLEGGYDLEALTGSVARVLDEMGGERLEESAPRIGAPSAYLPRIRVAQGRSWELPEA
jgi:acetoin utilization deacetylase AcuC-like enzyme